MTIEHTDTLIIGGGQAGLAMSHMLSLRGRVHLVLERARIAERWRSERWDGLRFQFPNWSISLPGHPFAAAQPDEFATSAQIVDYLEAYARSVAAPVRCGVEVTALRRADDGTGFVVGTSAGQIGARQVVIATGPYQQPILPGLIEESAALTQLHSSRYRAPAQLPEGAVLVVGAGASGAQIAEELLRAGRRVFLSVGTHRRLPRRYRGKDLSWWLRETGLEQTPAANRGPDRALPVISGAYGGATVDFRRFAREGVTLLGRIRGSRDGVLDIDEGLAQSLAAGDAALLGFLDLADAHVDRTGIALPAEPEAREIAPDPDCVRVPLRELSLAQNRIGTVLWATGFDCDYRWIDLPVFDGQGQPVHRDGVTAVPGVYFIGLQWLSKMNSSFLSGVGEDARRLAELIAAR